ncbi:MAG: metabolite traffic protein EboE [Planctomycetota bacterium]
MMDEGLYGANGSSAVTEWVRETMRRQPTIGYCTNVHAGTSLESICANLQEHAHVVRQQLELDTLPVGLWLPAPVAEQLEDPRQLDQLAACLDELQLHPYTLNGFPFGNFHGEVVKHEVYRPAWWEPSRGDYTLRLARHMAALLPEGDSASISTLPLGWPWPEVSKAHLNEAARSLSEVARQLRELDLQTGRHIRLCLEPEPGCLLQTSDDAVVFFEQVLRPVIDDPATLRHLGICHDVCHAVVMREPQAEAIQRYVDADIPIHKVQISSCVQVDFDRLDDAQANVALSQLNRFAEDRYLHQTTVCHQGITEFFVDLPDAIRRAQLDGPRGEWRTHFHVPIHLERFKTLETSQPAIAACIAALQTHDLACDIEVETYAWSVLPTELQTPVLAEGIATELGWLHGTLAAMPS